MLIMKTKLIFPLKFYVDLNKTFILSQLKTFRLLEKNIYCLCVYMPEIFYRFSLSFNRRNYLLEGLFEKNKNQEVVYKQMWFFFLIFSYYFFLSFFFFYFTILYWFCHTSTWIRHGCTRVPNPEPPSHLLPHTIPLGHPTLSLSLWVQKTVLYICVSFAVSHTGLSLPSF